MKRARFIPDGPGYRFEVYDSTGRMTHQGWCLGPRKEAESHVRWIERGGEKQKNVDE